MRIFNYKENPFDGSENVMAIPFLKRKVPLTWRLRKWFRQPRVNLILLRITFPNKSNKSEVTSVNGIRYDDYLWIYVGTVYKYKYWKMKVFNRKDNNDK